MKIFLWIVSLINRFFLKYKSIVSVIFVFGISSFLIWNIYKNFSILIYFPWNFQFSNIFFLLIFLLPIYGLNALAWHFIIHSFGYKIAFSKSFKIWVLSNCGRFLPGIIWQYTGRMYLASESGIPKTITFFSIVLEALLVIIASSIIAIIHTFLISTSKYSQQLQIFLITIIALALFLFIFTIFSINNNKLIIRLIKFLQKISYKKYKFKKIKINKKYLPMIMSIFLAQFLFGGLVLFFLSRLAIDFSLSDGFILISIYAISWLIGYLTIIAPAGLGAQELTMAGLLSLYMPFPVASIIAITCRLLLMSSEILSAFLIIFLSKKK